MVMKGTAMRIVFIAAACLACVTGSTWAQAGNDDKSSDKSGYSTGRTVSPETMGEKQPQGWTGPITTGKGGAPAASPQGQTPPGMQSAPEGSSKTTVEPEKSDEK
jgi:hypothetical protein